MKNSAQFNDEDDIVMMKYIFQSNIHKNLN
jgi:hypothetical protein